MSGIDISRLTALKTLIQHPMVRSGLQCGHRFGFTFDLHNVVDLTEASPIGVSTTPGQFHAWRYSHWIWVDNEIWIYAEVAKENDAHEIRLFRVEVE